MLCWWVWVQEMARIVVEGEDGDTERAGLLSSQEMEDWKAFEVDRRERGIPMSESSCSIGGATSDSSSGVTDDMGSTLLPGGASQSPTSTTSSSSRYLDVPRVKRI